MMIIFCSFKSTEVAG